MPDVFEEDLQGDVFEEDKGGDVFEEDAAPSPSPSFTKQDALNLPVPPDAPPQPPEQNALAKALTPASGRRDTLDTAFENLPGLGALAFGVRRISGFENISPVAALQEKVVLPLVDSFQKGVGQHVAKAAVPVVQAGIETGSNPVWSKVLTTGLPVPTPQISPTAANFLAREGLSWLAGPYGGVTPEPGEKATDEGVKALEQDYGQAAPYVQSLAHEGGKLPLYLAGTGTGTATARLIGRVAAEAPLLTRLLSSVAPAFSEGAAQGAIQGLATPGADVGTHAGVGGLFAGGITAATFTPQIYKVLASQPEVIGLGHEISNIIQKSQGEVEQGLAATKQGLKMGADAPIVKRLKEGEEISPLVTTVFFEPKSEKFYLRAMEVNAKEGTVRYRDVPTKDSEAAETLSRKLYPDAPHTPAVMLEARNTGVDVLMGEAKLMQQRVAETPRTEEIKQLPFGRQNEANVSPKIAAIKFGPGQRTRSLDDTLFSVVPKELQQYFAKEAPLADQERIFVMGATDEAGNIQSRAIKSYRKGEPSFDELQLREGHQTPPEVSTTAPPEFSPMWMRNLKEVTPQTVMGKTGKSLTESQAFLDKMAERGVLKPKGDGLYENAKLEAPERGVAGERRAEPVQAPNGATPGTFVYVKSPNVPESAMRDGPNGGRFAYGVYRGKASGNKFRVQYEEVPGSGKTKTVELTQDEFNSALPPGLGNAKLANLPPVYGETRPMPWQWPQQVQQAFVDATNATSKLYKNPTLLGGGQGMLAEIADKLSAKLLPGFKRGNPLSRELYLKAVSSQKGFNSDRVRLAEYLSKATSKNLTGNEAKLLLDYGKLTPGQRAQVQGGIFSTKLGQDMKTGIDKVLAGKDADSAWLASRGFEGIDHLEKLRTIGKEGQYVANAYANFVDPKEWLKLVDGTPAWDTAIGWMMKNGAKTTGDAITSLRAAMHAESPEAALLTYAQKATGKQHIKSRGQLPPELTNVLGRLESGPIQLAESVAAAKSLRKHVEIWDAVAESPFASRGPMQGFAPTPLPNEPLYGKAAGMYVHPDFLKMTPAALAADAQAASGIFGAGTSIMKYNFVVMNPVAWVRNAGRTIRGFMFSGVHEDPQSLFDAATSLVAEHKDPGGFGLGKLVAEARANGALSPAFSAIEQGAGSDAMKRKLFSELAQSMGKGGGWKDSLNTLARFKSNTKLGVRQAYEAFDTFSKLSAYAARRRYAVQVLGFNDNNAAAYASKWVNDAFPNYDVMSPMATAARDRGTVVAPFAPAASEDLRVLSNMGGRALQDPQAAKYMLQYLAFLGVTYHAMKGMARGAGITEQEEKTATDAQPNYTRAYYSPFSVALPTRGPKGELQLMDPVYDLEPIVGWARGMPQEDWWQRGLRNITQEFLGQEGQSMYGTMANKTMEAAGVLPSFERPNRPVGLEEGSLKGTLQTGAQLGLVPSGLTRGMRAYDATQAKNKPGEVLSPGAAVARGVLPIHQATPQVQQIRSIQEMQAFARRIQEESKSLMKNLPQGASSEQKAKVRDLIEAKMQVLKATLDDFQQRMRK